MISSTILALSLFAQLGSGDISSPIGPTSGNTTSGGLGGLDRSDVKLGGSDGPFTGGSGSMSTGGSTSSAATGASTTSASGTTGSTGSGSAAEIPATGAAPGAVNGTASGTASGTGIGGGTNGTGGMR
jgi:hypothetical protein